MTSVQGDQSHMQRALSEAQAAGARGEVPIGAVVTARTAAIIAAAGNRTRELNDPTAHAEMLAIRAACASLGAERLTGCDLYVTLEPCPMCAAAISSRASGGLYYGAPDPKGGGVEHGARVFNHPTCHHAPEIYPGIDEARAAMLLHSVLPGRALGLGGARAPQERAARLAHGRGRALAAARAPRAVAASRLPACARAAP